MEICLGQGDGHANVELVPYHGAAAALVVEEVDTDATLAVTLQHLDICLVEVVDARIVVECDANVSLLQTSPLRMLPSLLCYNGA